MKIQKKVDRESFKGSWAGA